MLNSPPTRAEITAQLDLVLASKEFSSSGRLKNFLAYVVNETLAGRGTRLKAYNIGVEAFGLGLNFDPSLNPSVRVAAGRLRAKLEQYYSRSNNNDFVRIGIPRGGYLPEFSYCAKRTSPLTAKKEAWPVSTLQNGLPDSLFTRSALYQIRPLRSGSIIALLPFSNLNNHRNLQPFLFGLTEEIANALAEFDELRVLNIQLSHDEALQTQPGTLPKAGFLLGGSAQIYGEDIRLRVTLLDTTTCAHIWAEKFDARLDSAQLFSLQDKIAAQVVNRIADSFGLVNHKAIKDQAEKSTAESEMYEALLCYHRWIASLTPQQYSEARAALERAMRLDPSSATIKAMLANLYASHRQWGLNIFENAAEQQTETLADQALEADGNNQYAHWARAYNCYLRRAEKCFVEAAHRAIELNPFNINIIAAAGMKLVMLGYNDEGLKMLNTALCLNPNLPCWFRSGLFIECYLREEYEAALDEAKQITTTDFMWGHLMRAAAYGKLGRVKQGRGELTALLATQPDFRKRGHDAMLLLFFQEKSVDKLVEGLKLSGL